MLALTEVVQMMTDKQFPFDHPNFVPLSSECGLSAVTSSDAKFPGIPSPCGGYAEYIFKRIRSIHTSADAPPPTTDLLASTAMASIGAAKTQASWLTRRPSTNAYDLTVAGVCLRLLLTSSHSLSLLPSRSPPRPLSISRESQPFSASV